MFLSAAINFDVDVLRYIENLCPDLKFQKDNNGDIALTLCASYGYEKTMRYLLEDLELDIKQTDEYGQNVW